MAFGLKTSHRSDYKTDEIGNSSSIYGAAILAAQELEWDFVYLGSKGFVAQTKASFKKTNNRVRVLIDDHWLRIRSECFNGEITDMGQNEEIVQAFSKRLQQKLNEVEASELDQIHEELAPSFTEDDADWLNLDVSAEAKWWEFFKPVKGYQITPILLIINVLIFIAMVISGLDAMNPAGESLLKWGANFRPATLNGEYWRLLSCCFIHIGLFHLLFNMYALLYIGVNLEPIIGKWKFLLAYLLTGIAASSASLFWNELTISAGASGAIFGMYGVFLALLTTHLIHASVRKGLLISMGIFVVYNLVYGLKDGIDNAAHLGGLLAGFVFGYLIYFSLKAPENKGLKASMMGLTTAVILGASGLLLSLTSDDIAKYDQIMHQFVLLEEKALSPFNAVVPPSDAELLVHIQDQGIPSWEACKKLMVEAQELDLSESLQSRNELLSSYIALRIASFNLMKTAISLGTDHFDEQMNEYNLKIEQILKQLSAPAS